MQHIQKLIWQQRQRIKSADTPIAEATLVMYEHIRDYLFEVVDTKFLNGGKIILLGGIQINNDPDDYFEPRICLMMDKYGSQDLLHEVYAYDSISRH